MSRSYIWQASRPAYDGHLKAAWRARDGALGAVARLIVGAYQEWRKQRRRNEARRQLEALDDRLLADLNLTRSGIQEAVDGMLERER